MENLVSTFDILKNSYAGKKVFLTGHTGFKGAWLLKLLTMLGATVKGYSLAPVNSFDLYHLIEGDTLCESIIADLRDKETLTEAIVDFEPDFVFHLAAQPLVRLSYEIPSETFEVNAIGTANLLDGVRLLNKACYAVLITTDKVYHNNEWSYPYRETDRLGGYDPYSASKACAELVIDCYRNSFFNLRKHQEHFKAIAVARAGNVIGGGDWSKDRIVPDIVKSLNMDEAVTIRNPNAVRPWQHVLEPLTGYLLLGSKLLNDPIKYSQAYNFGPDAAAALSVKELVEIGINCWGRGNYQVINEPNQPHEAGLLKLDISKAISDLGWKPKMSAKEAIENTLNWYKHYFNNKADLNDYTANQIITFLTE
jgi:CDP-glucose 4,6-dehydratase